MERITLLVILLPICASNGHSLWLLSTYIEGNTQFPKYSYTISLDDITLGYYNSETFIPRGNMTNEDDVINSDYVKSISGYMKTSFVRRSAVLRQYKSQNDSLDVYQTLVVCELLNVTTSGKMITKDAAGGCTTDELCYFNNMFTYTVTANITQDLLKPHLEEFKIKYQEFFYPVCIDTLKNYLKKRKDNLNSVSEPEVQIIQKANSNSQGFHVSCLATAFYPRHLNMSLFKDGQPVSDHEVTGGDLLPNGDGTYQMRKSLEIRGDERHKHTYSCSVTHLAKKWDIDLEAKCSHIGVAFAVLGLLCVISAVFILKRCQTPRGRNQTNQENQTTNLNST